MLTNQMQIQFEAILNIYGHDIFLQRRNQTTDYSCGEHADYSPILERHTVRYSIINSRSLMGRQQENMEGITSTSDRVYYFTKAAKPFDGDRIYETEERTEDLQSVWTIDTSIPMRGTGGNIMYYEAGVTRYKSN